LATNIAAESSRLLLGLVAHADALDIPTPRPGAWFAKARRGAESHRTRDAAVAGHRARPL